MVAPTSTEERLSLIASFTEPESFVYCVSTTGTTGAREELDLGLSSYIENVRKHFSQPLALGFGISTREQVQKVCSIADIAVVGSAAIDVISKCRNETNCASQIRQFINHLVG